MEAPNPFTERGPIRDPQRFFGRKAELTQIFERLTTMQSVSIVGERRTGKSSLLTFITATGSERLSNDYEFYYLDLQRVESTEDFIARVLDVLKIKEGKTSRDFEKAIEGHQIILCLDEFEHASEFSKEFFNVLRSLASTGHLALVTASQKKLVELASEGATTSPFFNIFTTVQLSELSESECAEVLRGLARLGEKDFIPAQIAAAYRATNGNPWKLQIFGYYLYQTNGDINQATTLYQAELDDNLRLNVNAAEDVKATGEVDAAPIIVHTGSAVVAIPAVLLVLAAVIGFLSALANFSPGMFVTLALIVISLLIEIGKTLRTRRGN